MVQGNIIEHIDMYPQKVRESNFELLRIISMLMIICGHLASQSGLYDCRMAYSNFGRYAITFLGNGHRIGVSLFVMIGVWFMTDKDFSSYRIIKLYLQLWFWSVFVTICTQLAGFNIPKGELIACFFPFVSYRYWFVSSYIIILLLSPYLRRCFDLPSKMLKMLIFVLFVVIVFLSTIHSFSDSRLDGISFFIFIYVVIGYYKRFLKDRIKPCKWLSITTALCLYAFLVIVIYVGESSCLSAYIPNGLSQKSFQFLIDYKSLPNFLISCCLFYFFTRLSIGSVKVINKIAIASFSVYIIHQTYSFYPILWSNIICVDYWKYSPYASLYMLLCSVALYMCVIPLYRFYTYFEHIVLNNNYIISKTLKIDRYIKSISDEEKTYNSNSHI